MNGRDELDGAATAGARSNPLITGSDDELKPRTRLELAIELRFASYELMRAGTAHIVQGDRRTGHACIVDSITLDTLVARLEAGGMSDGIAELFLAAAQTILGRRIDELEADRR